MLQRLYDWMMAKSAHPHAIWWLAAFSFMEASFFPIPPHPLLGLMCLAQPKQALRFAAVCTAASVLGGLLGYGIGYFLYETVGTAMLSALGLADNFPQAACYLRMYGAEIILIKGATPIPFKLLTITAGFIHMDLLTFVGASIVSRGVLFMVVGILFRVFGAPIKAFIEKYLALVTAAFLILLVGGFVIAGMASSEAKADACKDAAATVVR
jgi:membrane protein YqaA with SNARE-associated domain